VVIVHGAPLSAGPFGIPGVPGVPGVPVGMIFIPGRDLERLLSLSTSNGQPSRLCSSSVVLDEDANFQGLLREREDRRDEGEHG